MERLFSPTTKFHSNGGDCAVIAWSKLAAHISDPHSPPPNWDASGWLCHCHINPCCQHTLVKEHRTTIPVICSCRYPFVHLIVAINSVQCEMASSYLSTHVKRIEGWLYLQSFWSSSCRRWYHCYLSPSCALSSQRWQFNIKRADCNNNNKLMPNKSVFSFSYLLDTKPKVWTGFIFQKFESVKP